MNKSVFTRVGVLIALVLALSLASVGIGSAQQVVPVETGVVVVGSIPSDGATAAYSFAGNFGDTVTVRVIGVTPGMDPTITLLGPLQEPLLIQENDLMFPNSPNSALAVFRLFSTGTYTVVVSGTPGDFILSVEVQPAVPPVILELDVPSPLTFPLAAAPAVFAFNTDPALPTTLHVDSEPFNLNATIQVRDGTGQLVTLFQGDVDNACVSVAPGDELHTVAVSGVAEATGTITFTMSHGPCQLGPAPAPETIVIPAPQFVPIAIEGVCAASSFNNVNVRTGPGLGFPVITLWPARNAIQVVGRTEDGDWLLVQTIWFTGWMSAHVVSVTGPCDAVPVVPFDTAPPAATATPGLPAATPTPAATMTLAPTATGTVTEAPTATTGVEPTATTGTGPTATPTVTPTATATLELTPEVTPTVGG